MPTLLAMVSIRFGWRQVVPRQKVQRYSVDINNLAVDAIDASKITAEIVSIKFDVDPEFLWISPRQSSSTRMATAIDGRIEIFNEYGNTKANGGCFSLVILR